MSKRGPITWPHCTISGCLCVRTWASTAERRAAANSYRHWAGPQGRAVCACHPGATFPCDLADSELSDE